MGFIRAVCYQKRAGILWTLVGTHQMNWIKFPNGKSMLFNSESVAMGLSVSRFTQLSGFMGGFVGDMADSDGCVDILPEPENWARNCNNFNIDHDRCCIISKIKGDSAF